jgi:hypothetical protein
VGDVLQVLRGGVAVEREDVAAALLEALASARRPSRQGGQR